MIRSNQMISKLIRDSIVVQASAGLSLLLPVGRTFLSAIRRRRISVGRTFLSALHARYLDRLAAAVTTGHRRAKRAPHAPALSLPVPLLPFLPRISAIPSVSRRRRR